MTKPLPSLALEMSPDGIALHQLAFDGHWHEMSRVALDDAALREKLANMRGVAAKLEGRGFKTRLWLPPDQIIGQSLPLGGADFRAHEAEARAGIAHIAGGKPSDYAVQIGERDDGGGFHVAAVRLRTLQEAKAFAKSHGFRTRGFGMRAGIAGFSQPPNFHIPIDKVKTAGLAFVGTATAAAVLGGGFLFYKLDPFNMWELPPRAADFAPFQQPNPGIERAGAPALPPVQRTAPAAPEFAALSANNTRYSLPYLPPRQLTADAQEEINAPAAPAVDPAPQSPSPAQIVAVNWPADIAPLPAPSDPDSQPALGLFNLQNSVVEPPQPEADAGTTTLPPIGPLARFNAPPRPLTVANTAFFLEPLPATATRLSPDALDDFVRRSGLTVEQLSRMASPLMLMESKVVGVTSGLPPILPVLRSGRAIPEQVAPPAIAPEAVTPASPAGPAQLFSLVEGAPAIIPPLRPATPAPIPSEEALPYRLINGAPDIRPVFRPAETPPAEPETPPAEDTTENTVAPEIAIAEATQPEAPSEASDTALANAVSAAIAAATPPLLEDPQLFALVEGQPELLPRLRSGAAIPPLTQTSTTPRAGTQISPETAEANALRPRRRPQAIIDLPAPIDPMISGAAPASSTRPAHRNASFDANAARIAETISNRPRASTPPVPVDPGRVSLPTSASVARAATIENAINLRTTNLIGIFGTADNRTALIRLSGGRMVRVKLGQTFSGWTVVAISEDTVRIRKRSREEILRMPAE